MVSDHVPIVVSISTFRPRDSPKRLAPWITRHPLFRELLDGAIRALPDADPRGRLAETKSLMFEVAEE
eukprot:8603791-Pyramimonas_sp.AAC.1